MESESIAGVVFKDGIEGDIVEEVEGFHVFVFLATVESDEGLGIFVDFDSELRGRMVPELLQGIIGVYCSEAPFVLSVFESIVKADSSFSGADSESEVDCELIFQDLKSDFIGEILLLDGSLAVEDCIEVDKVGSM